MMNQTRAHAMKKRSAEKASARSQAVAYARVSTTTQAEEGVSLDAQLGEIRRRAADRGITIAREFVERGASGTDDQRPVFNEMMEFCLAPDAAVSTILVYQTSRFMRDAFLARYWKRKLERQGIRVIAVTQETANDPNGQLIEGLYELLDQHESKMIGARTSAALRHLARLGCYPAPRTPFGFTCEPIAVGSGPKRRKLVPHPEEAEIVREVFRLYVFGSGALATAQELNRRRLFERGTRWTNQKVLKVIEETATIGTYYFGKYAPKTRRPRDQDEWIAIPVQPIVERELFDVAQKVRADRDPEKTPGRTGSSPLLLAGLVRCGKCGAAYQLETSGKQNANGEYPHRYYNCRTSTRGGKESCPGFRIKTQVLEGAVLEHIADKLFTFDRCKLLVRDLVEETGIVNKRVTEERQRLEKELGEIDRRLARYFDAFESGEMPRDVGAERVRELQKRQIEVKDTLAKVVPIRPPATLYADATIERFQRDLRGIFLAGDNALAKSYLRFLIEKITVKDREVTIEAKANAALTMMAAGNEKAGGSGIALPPAEVLTSVPTKLRKRDSNPRPSG